MPDLPAARPSGKRGNTSPTLIPIRTVEIPAGETDEAIDVEFRVVSETFPIGVLEVETYELEGPWSPNPVVDRYLAKRRREAILRAQREYLKSVIRANHTRHRSWWSRKHD